MKKFFILLLCTLLGAGAASAQRLQLGVRGGVNTTDYKLTPTRIGDNRFTAGPARIGYEAGFVLRLNLSRHLHLQSELNYNFVNYNLRSEGKTPRQIVLRTQRFEIPVELGLQLGVVRLFGGASFRVADSERSSIPRLLKVDFNDHDTALVGGIGLNIRKFFLDLRVTGYPRSHVWQNYTSYDKTQRVRVKHDLVYGGSLGFFF